MSRLTTLFLALAVVLASLVLTAPRSDARAVLVEPPSVNAVKSLHYVEPYAIKRGTPRRLFVVFSDGSAYIFTPCRFEDGRNCFWWAPGVGNKRGRSFIDLRGTLYRL